MQAARPALAVPEAEALEPTKEFLEAAEALGIAFDPGDLEKLGGYLALMLAANEVMNLTGIKTPREAWMRHIFDALTLVPMLAELPEKATIIDVGTGGGVPGVPLAIVMPHVKVTLLEATGKKTEFLRQVASRLGLKNVVVLKDRAENAGQSPHYREKFDAVVVRAVGAMNVIAELTVPLCKQGGVVLAIKGAKADEEVEAARLAIGTLGARFEQTLDTPTGRVVALSKQSKTPKMYPRRDGEPARVPLGVPTV